MKFSICNLGCKVNAYEAESVASLLEEQGWERVSFDAVADASFIFTCAVTNTAAAKSRKMLHRVKRLNPATVTAVVGCYAQLNDGQLEDADIIVGTAQKGQLPKYLFQYLQTHEKIRVVDNLSQIDFEPLLTNQFENHSRAYLKIQDGCNQFCSYCVIPYARGRERSMHPDMVIHEMKELSKSYSEVVLTGIHTGRYGKEYGVSLAAMIRRILAETEIERIRISSIEVTEVTDELIQLMKEEPKRIARHLHIPLQSGSDGVLYRMHRPYTTQQYLKRITEIRKELGNVAISCDLITGFPQETEEEHHETMDFIRACQFSFLHVFPYSMREGTEAAKMPGHIDPSVKKQRATDVIALSKKLSDEYQQSRVGQIDEIISENYKNSYTQGYTSDYILVKVKGKLPHGKSVPIQLVKFEDGQMYAEERQVL